VTEQTQLQELDETFERVLCVVAHPDDIEYGTAAAVAKWAAAGSAVSYFLLTRGEAGIDTMHPREAAPLREEEQRAAGAAVGVSEINFGTHRDGVVEAGLDLRRDIAREIRRRRPHLVVAGPFEALMVAGGTAFLNQSDHRAVGLATMDACADAGNRWIFTELLDEGLDPWHVPTVAVPAMSGGTHFVDVTGYMDAAVASLEAHRTYNEALPDDFPKPPELLAEILGGGGKVAGVDHALVLQVFRR
jgi:LmbE family N-acetylglucosaminyl deacetylase